MTLRWLSRVGIAAAACSCALAGCSDDSTPTVPGTAGTTSGGTSAGNASGGTSAGSAVAGSASAGHSGNTNAGSGGVAGTSAAGSSGSGGVAGSGGSAGHAGTAGSAGTSTDSGGVGGEGGATNTETLLYDFETDAQGWAASDADVAITVDAAQFVTGAKSLKAVVPALAISGTRSIQVKNAQLLWPGAKVVLHLWTPAGTDTLWAQAYSQSDNWKSWDTTGNGAISLVRGGWTTLTYTVPNTFPGGLQALGVQVGAGDSAFAGGDFYIDSVVVSGGVESCAGTGTGSYDFEAAAITPWQIDGNPATPDTALAASTTEANSGTGSLKVSFTALAAGTIDTATARRIFAYAPNAYCGTEVTFNVWTPIGSEALNFQGFSQSDNYSGWDAAPPAATVTRGGWTQLKYTIPASVGPGGLQLVGLQFLNTGDAFTGDVYVDDVSW